MSKAKKSTPSSNQEANPASHHADNPSHPDHKGFLNLAGEAFVVLGAEIVEGKDKVVEVMGEKFTTLKSAISNLTHKKKKARPKKAVKKAAPVKKVAKKAAVAKKKVAPAKKKAASKKAAKRKR
jgi:hypothetical protein